MTRKVSLMTLSPERQFEILKLKAEVRQQVGFQYTPFMVQQFGGKYESEEAKKLLRDFMNGRKYDSEVEKDFKELLKVIENEKVEG